MNQKRPHCILRLKYFAFIIIVLLISGCFSSKENIFLKGFMLDGFEQYGALSVYNRDNLFAYMNGEAETYLEKDFLNLYIQNFQEYESGAEVLVEIYDMKGEKGALNIFDEYTQNKGTYLKDFGENAWTDNYLVLFIRGDYFCRISPDPLSEMEIKPTVEDMVDIGRKLDDLLKNS